MAGIDRIRRPSFAARRFFAVAAASFAAAALLAWALIRFVPAAAPTEGVLLMPVAFWFSTAMLALTSFALGRSLGFVKRERQRLFRRWLVAALCAAVLFLGVQIFGLRQLLMNQAPDEAQTSANTFVFVMADLHALHVTVAMMFLAFVTARAFVDRYDHEYYWGVTVCAYFWHALGLVWLAILAVVAIAS